MGYMRGPIALIAAVSVLAALFPTIFTYLAAKKLTGQIGALQRSTESIASGDLDSPVDVDCSCEVGGLADSFRKMVKRLNSNILRMNILAYNDAVTGLPNRAVITHMLDKMTADWNFGGGVAEKSAVMFIDLDGFKRVNDTLGHEAGDELLKQVSLRIIYKGLDRSPEQLDTCTTPFGELCDRRPTDIAFARFAGDEFVALLPGIADVEELKRLATAIIASLDEPFLIQGNQLKVGASIGIARIPFDSSDTAELLNFADLAMYEAKKAGKNCCNFFNPALRSVLMERDRIETDLRAAIENEEFVLHFQPKLDALTFECVGLEALVRWNHPTRGLVAPGVFIAIAEQTGLMPALGLVIVKLAARQIRSWVASGARRNVAINVSAIQFGCSNLVLDILDILKQHEVDPTLVEIEITESMAMSDYLIAVHRIDRLQSAGVKISIDDFGIGFSNLSQLARLPFDALKIDQSLIADIGENAKSEAIIKALVGMAHALGYTTIAEGIETPRQLAFLQQIGCDRVQGFLLGRPMPAEEIDAWEQNRSSNSPRAMQAHLALQMAGQ